MLKKKRFIPQLSDITPNNEDFAHLLESVNTSHVKEGMVVKGQVVETNLDVIVVDVGLKNEGRIPAWGAQFPPGGWERGEPGCKDSGKGQHQKRSLLFPTGKDQSKEETIEGAWFHAGQ